MPYQTSTLKILKLAEKHIEENDSALLCWQDANRCFDSGREQAAIKRALDSLKHSVGVFHSDYKVAVQWAKEQP